MLTAFLQFSPQQLQFNQFSLFYLMQWVSPTFYYLQLWNYLHSFLLFYSGGVQFNPAILDCTNPKQRNFTAWWLNRVTSFRPIKPKEQLSFGRPLRDWAPRLSKWRRRSRHVLTCYRSPTWRRLRSSKTESRPSIATWRGLCLRLNSVGKLRMCSPVSQKRQWLQHPWGR